MSAIYDNWERLVNATLLREKFRQLSRLDSISTTSSESSGSFPGWDPEDINWPNLGISFSYKEIAEATNHFSDENLIKRGHSGDLFTGNFPQISTSHFVERQVSTSSTLVVKRIRFDQASGYWENLTSELKFYSRIDNSRSRFVPLVGHCLESEQEKFLIYVYLEKRDLTNSFFFKTANGSLASLDWITRLKIAIGVAESLSFMHDEYNPPLAHRDVQSSSILLDNGFQVRLGSLSEVCAEDSNTNQSRTRIMRWLRLPKRSGQGVSSRQPNTTCAHDVYCFGKVLLELVTGKLDISSSPDTIMKAYLETTLLLIYDKELVRNIIDPSLKIDEDLLEEVWAMAIVAKSCLNPKPDKRPLMRYILKALENPLKVVGEEQSSSARLKVTPFRRLWGPNLIASWLSSSDVGPARGQGPLFIRLKALAVSNGRGLKKVGELGMGMLMGIRGGII